MGVSQPMVISSLEWTKLPLVLLNDAACGLAWS